MIETIEGTIGIYGATLLVAIASGFIPIINIEIYLAAVVLVTKSLPLAILLGVIAAIGQMVAKIGIYKASRAGANMSNAGMRVTPRPILLGDIFTKTIPRHQGPRQDGPPRADIGLNPPLTGRDRSRSDQGGEAAFNC